MGNKETEVGPIPNDWEVHNIASNSTMKARIGWQGLTTAEYLSMGDYFLVTGTDFFDGKIKWETCHHVTKDRFDQDKNIQLKQNDILITKDGTIGKVALIDELPLDATLNSGVFVIRPIDNAYDPKYCYYIFKSQYFDSFLRKLVAGSTINHLYQKDFVSFQFPLPPKKAEQTAIATALSNIDNLIDGLKKLISKKKAIKQGAMQKLLRPKEEWVLKRLGDVFTFFSTSNYSKAEMFTEGDVGCIHYGLIHAVVNSNYSLKNGVKYYITKEQAKYERIQNGDIIMVDASEDLVGLNKSIEIADIEDREYIAGLHTFHLRDKQSVYVKNFRGLILNSTYIKNQMLRLAVGMKVFGVSKPQLQQILVPVPPIELQTEIANILSDMDDEIMLLEENLEKYRLLKQGMMQELLTGKTRLL